MTKAEFIFIAQWFFDEGVFKNRMGLAGYDGFVAGVNEFLSAHDNYVDGSPAIYDDLFEEED